MCKDAEEGSCHHCLGKERLPVPGQAPVNFQYPLQRSLEAANFEAGG